MREREKEKLHTHILTHRVIASPVMSATTGNVPVFTFAAVLIFDETFWYLWHYVLVQQRPNVLIIIIILLALLVHCHVTRVYIRSFNVLCIKYLFVHVDGYGFC